jgi:hypothetical protein
VKRLLTASALCIAATINAGLLGAASATVLSVLTGMMANEVGSGWERLGKYLSDPASLLANHDLTRAVGLAIAAVLAQTAKNEEQVHYTDRNRVCQLVKYVAQHWTEFYQENLLLFPENSAIQEHQLGSLFLGEVGVTVRVFSEEIEEDRTIWQGILEGLIPKSGAFTDLLAMPESAEELHQTVVNLAKALSSQFTQALREVFKEDFATGGRAFAGLSLDLLQLIHQSIMRSQAEIIERLDRLAVAPNLASLEGTDQLFLEELARLREQSWENQADLVAFKRDLQGDVNRVNQQLVLLRSDNLEAFIQLGDRLESGFGNLRPLFDEIGLKLEDLFAVTVAGFQEVKETQQEIIEKIEVGNQNVSNILAIVQGLDEQRILEQSKRSPILLTLGKPPKLIAHWQGRAEEIQQLQTWFSDRVSLIGIDGVGGIGKSSLAGKVFAEVISPSSTILPNSPILPTSPTNFDRGFWADVSSGVLFTDLARQVIEAFGGRVPEQERDLVDGLVSCLQSGRFLVVVDNLESLLTAEGQWSSEFYGDFFTAWLELGSNSTILVTTREKPDLRGMEWLDLTGLSVTEGANLLAELGIKGNLAEFSALVGGYPLLLKLVADLLKDEYPQDPHLERLTALGLGNLQQLLTDERVKGVHRRQTVAIVAVLEAMVARLSPQQRHFWQRLSVFRPAFDSEAASYLVQEGPETLVPPKVGYCVHTSKV